MRRFLLNHNQLSATKTEIHTSNDFSSIAHHLASFLCDLSKDSQGIYYDIFYSLVQKTREGDLCIRLESIKNEFSRQGFSFPEFDLLEELEVVGLPESQSPIVISDNKIYLRKYYQFENQIRTSIVRLLGKPIAPVLDLDLDLVATLFAPDQKEDKSPDDQKLAAISALIRNFLIITGGPGTGKTTTVLKILALKLSHNPDLRIALVAPTGKAANRLQTSIESSMDRLPVRDSIKQKIPHRVGTIHRLLGSTGNPGKFHHHEGHPLPFDLIVADEASMIDAATFSRLLSAMDPDASLFLVGDRNQLASVEAGAVLGDLCDAGGYIDGKPPHYSIHMIQALKETAGMALADELPLLEKQQEKKSSLNDSICGLNKNYRFSSSSGISELSQAVRDGDVNLALSILDSSETTDVNLFSGEKAAFAFKESLISSFSDGSHQKRTPEEALARLDSSIVLGPLRKGNGGVDQLNSYIRHILIQENLLEPARMDQFPHGTPVMVTKNDYLLSLFNGDTGLIWRNGQDRWVLFPSGQKSANPKSGEPEKNPDSPVRFVSLDMLENLEVAFAITVHKSQGSEYDHVDLVLPPPGTRTEILTSELLYTAITRARNRFTIYGDRSVLSNMIGRKIQRVSGLSHRF